MSKKKSKAKPKPEPAPAPAGEVCVYCGRTRTGADRADQCRECGRMFPWRTK